MAETLAADLIVQDIPISDILSDSTFNCRGPISAFDVRELIEDVRVRKLQTPITVMPYEKDGYKWKILAGHRRFEAVKALDWKTIPSFVKSGLDEQGQIIFNLTENLKRQDLNPLQEAKTIEKLFNHGWKPYEISRELGVSIGWAQDRFRLLEMPEEIQQDVSVGLLKITDIKKLARETSVDQQYELAKLLKDARLTGKKTAPVLPPQPSNKKVARSREQINEIQQIIYKVFGSSITTRALAWAQGEIDDAEMHEALKEEADNVGVPYSIPLHLRRSPSEVHSD